MSTIAIALILFPTSKPGTLDSNFYGFLALNEFYVLMFMRTRSSLKYYPLASNAIFFIFLYYFQMEAYGFSELGLYLMVFSILCLQAYILRKYEIPSTDWNPFHKYTPS
jgi:hypothetical protein